MRKLESAPHGLHGQLEVPGDKSISHRALMLGAVATGTTTIEHWLPGADCLHTLQALRDVGVIIERQGTQVTVQGQGGAQHFTAPTAPLEMGNSGTTTRLLMGLLSGAPFTSTLVGDASLQQRPMQRVTTPLAELGVTIDLTEAGTLPAHVHGGPVHGGTVRLAVASAQVKSAVLLAGLTAPEPTVVVEKLPTRDHTEIMLRQFGAEVTTAADHRTITLQPHPQLTGQTVVVPGDLSSAAFFLVAATIVPNSEIRLTNVNLNPTRTGILRVLTEMGADVTVQPMTSAGEPRGDLIVRSQQLRPIHLTASEIPAVIDELPLVALLAATANGTSTIRGAAELRVKETDRIAVLKTELEKLGVTVSEYPDGLAITGRPEWQPQTTQLDSHGDHRIGMMLAIAALRSQTPLTLQNESAVAVSYPQFFTDLEHLREGS
ncbi:3-phosphoshikimate 1-carboxyvinyltransferase [Fructilactobacillus myrtifloralis]|uniref:3-phosphoshikimate 1-carboxyvinyltransferase n=1 Tax=Fructilactobacillus myrtifloralis TaxID=2940301 RepID=A0ABY5BMP8_9LACO|nr:3-phosphoshikimate 1-carboxyvinyltransferase [Fructilactobacillus myrtifloralis]USS84505.1 3-phosphoshikimate 1-carboxyvinyltransferase [Fructilactobacillus myrtifloralis]